ncbi:MAG: GspMb/PilO family protein [Fimbriimonadales bacterium]|nr:GspMb/PilO family protein [Fimbriimonadales bacterium]
MKARLTTDGWAILIKWLCAAALLAGLAYLWWPKGDASLVDADAKRRQERQLEQQIALTKRSVADLEAQVNRRVFALEPDQVGPKALAAVEAHAKRCGLALSSFRPQKAVQSEGLEQLGFTANVSGPFPDVIQFLRLLESDESRLAVVSAQFNAGDQGVGDVSATVGLVAFAQPPKPKTTQSGARTARRTSGGGL